MSVAFFKWGKVFFRRDGKIVMRRGAAAVLIILLMLVSLLLLQACAGSYTRRLSVLSREEARQDIEQFARNVEAIHYNPFHTVSEKDFRAAVDREIANLPEPVSHRILAGVLARIGALIGDSHTAIHWYGPFRRYIENGGVAFPVPVVIKGERLTVASAWDGVEGLEAGDVIGSINGVPTAELLSEMFLMEVGDSDRIKWHRMEEHFPMAIWYALGPVEEFVLEVERSGIGREVVVVEAASESLSDASNRIENPYSVNFMEEGRICLIRADSFWHTRREEWQSVVDEAIDEMRANGTEILIVDVRENGGGDSSFGHYLLRRVIHRPVGTGVKFWRYSRAYQEEILKVELTKRKIPAWLNLHKFLDLSDYTDHIPETVHDSDQEFFQLSSMISPSADVYLVDLAVLAGPNTSSAAVDFVRTVKDNKLGIVLGEETGDAASYYSEIGYFVLFNSGLTGSAASAFNMRPAGFDDGRGVMPDVSLPPDGDMETVIQAVSKHW